MSRLPHLARLGTGGWARLVAANLARIAVTAVVALAGWGAAPAALGWQPTTVMSDSMRPRIATGDVVVSMPIRPDRLKPDQVVLADDPDRPGKLRFHRLVRFADDGRLVLKGDANPAEDSSPVAADAVHGVGVLRVPRLGTPIVWLFTGQWSHLAALLGVATVVAGATTLDRRLLGEPSRSLAASALAAGTAAALAVSAGAAGAAANAVTQSPASTLGAADYFSCASAVRASDPEIYYRLQESGSAAVVNDASGHSNDGAYVGSGRTARVTGACGHDETDYAVALNGSSSYLVGPSVAMPAPNTFTVALWFKASTTRGGKLVGFGNTRTGRSTVVDRHVYLLNSGRLSFGVRPGGGTRRVVTTSSAYNDGRWHHVAASLGSNGMRLYVDGELAVGSTAYTSGQSYQAYLRVGYDDLTNWASEPTSDYFAGSVDEVSMYRSVLGASAIRDQYGAGTP